MKFDFNFENVLINYTSLVEYHYKACEQNFLFLLALREPPIWPIFLLAATCTVASVGICGNTLNIWIFLRKRVAYSHLNPLLIGLSISDLSVSVHQIAAVALPQILLTSGAFEVTQQSAKYVLDMKMCLTYTWITSCVSSLYFIVGISTERFIAVCWPLKTAAILTPGRTRRIAIFIGIFAATLNSPLLVYILVWIISQSDKWDCFLTPYYMLPLVIFGALIPIPSVMIFNTVIIWKVIKRHKEANLLQTQQELKTMKTTKMLVCVMSVFMLCVGLGCIDVFFVYDSLIQFQISQFIITFNSAVNYFIYCGFRKGFRDSFPTVFVVCCTKKYCAKQHRYSHS